MPVTLKVWGILSVSFFKEKVMHQVEIMAVSAVLKRLFGLSQPAEIGESQRGQIVSGQVYVGAVSMVLARMFGQDKT